MNTKKAFIPGQLSIVSMLLLIFFFLITSCNKGDDLKSKCDIQNDEPIPREIIPVQIGKGDLYGGGSENIPQQNIIVKDQEAWGALLMAINSNGNISGSFTEVDIDFNCFIIIAAFDSVKPNGGHSIDITGIIENESDITVTIKNLLKGDATQVITQPFHLVKIPKSQKPVAF